MQKASHLEFFSKLGSHSLRELREQTHNFKVKKVSWNLIIWHKKARQKLSPFKKYLHQQVKNKLKSSQLFLQRITSSQVMKRLHVNKKIHLGLATQQKNKVLRIMTLQIHQQ